MLSGLVKDSKARRAEIATDNERLKKEAMESVGAATTAAMDTVNVGVATVWHNQQQLEAEARALQQQAQRFNKQTAQWLTTFQSFHQSLKALGDVENWARTIEADMAFINSSLEQVVNGECADSCLSDPIGICPRSVVVSSGGLSAGFCKDISYTVADGTDQEGAGPCGTLTFNKWKKAEAAQLA